MYCYHCGKKVSNEDLIENGEGKIVCPNCKNEFVEHLEEKELKTLTQSSHNLLHKFMNIFNSGMCGVVIGAIALSVGMLFFTLCFRLQNNNQFSTTCTEFYVFVSLVCIGGLGVLYGLATIPYSIIKLRQYKLLIRDIQNKTFVQ